MVDPLSEVITLLQPRTVFSKGISGAGRWGVRYADVRPAELLHRARRKAAAVAWMGRTPLHARGGRLRAACRRRPPSPCRASSRSTPRAHRPQGDAIADRGGAPRHGATARRTCGCSAATSSSARPTRRSWCRYCRTLVHVRGDGTALDAGAARRRRGERAAAGAGPRACAPRRGAADRGAAARPRATTRRRGCCAGLADARLAVAIRRMHGDPERPWTVAELAKEAGLSRSAFFDRFARSRRPAADGVPARLAHGGREGSPAAPRLGLAEVARRVGYGSASTFSTAFSRHVGQPPGRYARAS